MNFHVGFTESGQRGCHHFHSRHRYRAISHGPTLVHAYCRRAPILLMILDGQSQNFNLLSMIALNGPYMAPALAAIVGSFGRRVNWLLGVVLTLVWCCSALAYIFIFGGPNGPPPVIQLSCALIAVIGIVIVVLSYRAFARDF